MNSNTPPARVNRIAKVEPRGRAEYGRGMTRTVLFASVLLVAGTTAAAKAGFLETLKVDAATAQDAIFNSLMYGSAYCPGTCRTVPAGARAEVAKAAVAFAKAYSNTDDFKKRYAAQWASDEPKAPTTPEAQMAEEAEQQKQSDLAQQQADKDLQEKAATEKDPNLKKVYTDAIATRSQMKQAMNDPKYKATMDQYKQQHVEQLRTQYAEDKTKYEQAHAEWAKLKDPKALIAKRIDEALALLATVDFRAKTVTRDGRKYFADEALEAKPSNWKQLYRMGPEVCDALKTAVKKWKAEL